MPKLGEGKLGCVEMYIKALLTMQKYSSPFFNCKFSFSSLLPFFGGFCLRGLSIWTESKQVRCSSHANTLLAQRDNFSSQTARQLQQLTLDIRLQLLSSAKSSSCLMS